MKLQGCWPVALAFAAGLAQAAVADDAPQLSLPIVCEPHKTCFIQNYVDIDPSPGAKDYACGSATYDQHSGVDFRVLSAEVTKTPVAVVASADGTVKGARDGVEDVFFKKADPRDIARRECGNGVIIDHGSGWETQYCHMKKGSVRVTKGQAVKRGDQLGEVGYSGMADFAQVHLTVRHDGKIVDPFLPEAAAGACQTDAKGPGLWEPSAANAFPYKNGELIAADFAGAPPDANTLETDHRVSPLTTQSPTLLLYGRFINLVKGDHLHFVATGPNGGILDESAATLTRGKATYVSFAAKKRGDEPWPVGGYEGRIELVRDGAVIATGIVTLDLK